jgi:hypothetical protein
VSTPIAGAALFAAVMAAAGGRCHCTGQCGQPHTTTEGRCLKTHDSGRVRLIAAPADPAVSERTAAALPANGLRAWCPACYGAAQRKSQIAQISLQTTGQQGLFDV